MVLFSLILACFFQLVLDGQWMFLTVVVLPVHVARLILYLFCAEKKFCSFGGIFVEK